MPPRKRKPFVPPSWVEQTSDNEWQVTSIPSIVDMGNIQRENQDPRCVREPSVEMSDDDEGDEPEEMELSDRGVNQSQNEFAIQAESHPNSGPIPSQNVNATETKFQQVLVQNPLQSRPIETSEESDNDQTHLHYANSPQTEFHSNDDPSPFPYTHSPASEFQPGNDCSHFTRTQSQESELMPNDNHTHSSNTEFLHEDDDMREEGPIHNNSNTMNFLHEEDIEEEEEEEDDELEDGNAAMSFVTYKDALANLAEQWLVLETKHRVLKRASSAFWRLAKSRFSTVYNLKKDENITKKVPQFDHLRRLLNNETVPEIAMEVAYKNKETEEVTVLKNLEKLPVSKYPPDKFTKLYEQASVKAEDIIKIHELKCPGKQANEQRKVQYSCDFVSECKSNVVSLDVYSFKMPNCRQIYPHKIVRPLNNTKINNDEILESVILDLHLNSFRISQFLADNLKRATAKGCLNHASLFPCEYCFARGERVVIKISVSEKKKYLFNYH